MTEHTYKIIEMTGSSKAGIEEAIQNAITRTHETVRNLRWLEVTGTRGCIENGKVAYWQVTLKVGFDLEGK